jgi:TolA-binding protein
MNTACDKFDTALLDLVYGELPDDQAEALRQHAAACPRCREALEQFKLVRKMAGELPPLEPTADLDEQVLRAAAAAIEPRPLPAGTVTPGPGWWERTRAAMLTPALATAAVATLVFVLTFFLAERSPDQQGALDGEIAIMEQETAPDVKSVAVTAAPAEAKDKITAAPEPPAVRISAKPTRARRRAKPAAAPKPAERKKFARAPAPVKMKKTSGSDSLRSAPRASAKAKSAPEAASTYDEGQAAYARGDCRTAQTAFERTIEQPGSSPAKKASALHYLARCEKRRGRCGQAIARYNALLSDYPGYTSRPEALWEASACHRRLGQKDRARARLMELKRAAGWQTKARKELDSLSE